MGTETSDARAPGFGLGSLDHCGVILKFICSDGDFITISTCVVFRFIAGVYDCGLTSLNSPIGCFPAIPQRHLPLLPPHLHTS